MKTKQTNFIKCVFSNYCKTEYIKKSQYGISFNKNYRISKSPLLSTVTCKHDKETEKEMKEGY